MRRLPGSSVLPRPAIVLTEPEPIPPLPAFAQAAIGLRSECSMQAEVDDIHFSGPIRSRGRINDGLPIDRPVTREDTGRHNSRVGTTSGSPPSRWDESGPAVSNGRVRCPLG